MIFVFSWFLNQIREGWGCSLPLEGSLFLRLLIVLTCRIMLNRRAIRQNPYKNIMLYLSIEFCLSETCFFLKLTFLLWLCRLHPCLGCFQLLRCRKSFCLPNTLKIAIQQTLSATIQQTSAKTSKPPLKTSVHHNITPCIDPKLHFPFLSNPQKTSDKLEYMTHGKVPYLPRK